MKRLQIATVACIALAALSSFAGEQDVVSEFDQLPDAQKDGLLSGIDMLLSDQNAGADARHNAWMEKMLADGWKFSKKRDDAAKTHPRLVPFDSLPKKEVAKETLLHAIVRTMASGEQPSAAVTKTAPAVAGTVPVKYIGKKDEHKDNLYGTSLEWKPGQVHHVPAAAAAKMLAHTDTYAQDGVAVAGVAESNAPAKDAAPQKLPVPLPNLDGMTAQELVNFAQQHYGDKLPDDMSKPDMEARVLSLVQLHGR